MQPNLFGIDNAYKVPSAPYMGNKSKLATRIINEIISFTGKRQFNFYDLFGGGGSVSVAALHNPNIEVHYNEYNTATFNLINHIKSDKPLCYDWIFKNEFDNRANDNSWKEGLIQTCWTFGSNQKDYLYSKDSQILMNLAHRVCVNQDKEALSDLEDLLKIKIILDLGFSNYDFQNRILDFRFRIHDLRKQLKLQVQKNTSLKTFQQQHLQNINKLEVLREVRRLKSLKTTNLSYEQVSIKDKVVFYCDIPYKNRYNYKKDDFCHDRFYDWALSQKHPVFISEYDMPNEFKAIKEFDHHTNMSRAANNTKTTEKLYWNGIG